MRRQTLLDGLGSRLDPPRPGPGDEVSHHLQRAIEAARAGSVGSGPRRSVTAIRRRRLVTAAPLATVLTVAGLTVQTFWIAGHSPASSASAAEILNQAALAAEREPALLARPDQFVFTEWTSEVPVDPPQTRRLQRWRSADGTRDGVLRWRLEGETSGWHEEVQPVSEQPGPGYRTDLPSDPEQMLRYLYAQRPKVCDGNGWCLHYKPGDPDVADFTAFITATDMLDTYVPPAARAALFQAIARIPAMTVVRNVHDAAGRPGIAVRHHIDNEFIDLIFDPVTYQYLGGGISLSGQTYRTTNRRVAIVDRAGQLP